MIRWWAALAFAGLLVGASAVLGLVALAGSALLLPVALAGAWLGYRLWRTASARIVDGIYRDVGGNPLEEEPDRDDDGVAAEDWHRGGGIDGSATDGGHEEWTPPESDPDRWPWQGAFWREDDDPDATATAEAEANANATAGPTSDAGAGTGTGTGPGPTRERRRATDGAGTGSSPHGDPDGTTGSTGETSPGDARDGGRRWWRRDDWGPGTGSGSGPGADADGSRSRSRGRDRSSRGDRSIEAAYETLGLEPGADAEAVRRAYRERVKETHPDTSGGSAEAFREVRRAYDRLRERLDDLE